MYRILFALLCTLLTTPAVFAETRELSNYPKAERLLEDFMADIAHFGFETKDNQSILIEGNAANYTGRPTDCELFSSKNAIQFLEKLISDLTIPARIDDLTNASLSSYFGEGYIFVCEKFEVLKTGPYRDSTRHTIYFNAQDNSVKLAIQLLLKD